MPSEMVSGGCSGSGAKNLPFPVQVMVRSSSPRSAADETSAGIMPALPLGGPTGEETSASSFDLERRSSVKMGDDFGTPGTSPKRLTFGTAWMTAASSATCPDARGRRELRSNCIARMAAPEPPVAADENWLAPTEGTSLLRSPSLKCPFRKQDARRERNIAREVVSSKRQCRTFISLSGINVSSLRESASSCACKPHGREGDKP
eukprot:scaffold35722_cov32-Tisochrysis_lutea.AAC.1